MAPRAKITIHGIFDCHILNKISPNIFGYENSLAYKKQNHQSGIETAPKGKQNRNNENKNRLPSVSAIIKPRKAEPVPPESDGPLSSPSQLSVGLLLKDRRIVLGWLLEAASRKTGIPAQVLPAIDETPRNIFINDVRKLDRHIGIYAYRLGQSLLGHDVLIA